MLPWEDDRQKVREAAFAPRQIALRELYDDKPDRPTGDRRELGREAEVPVHKGGGFRWTGVRRSPKAWRAASERGR